MEDLNCPVKLTQLIVEDNIGLSGLDGLCKPTIIAEGETWYLHLPFQSIPTNLKKIRIKVDADVEE